ncbi:helix-turn-helix domain-containing protein [Pseudochrobactrum algeriensis]|uniref:helix-turn-helix domain-containing protein n=1 Tax=Pseudochrobactrum algeriensis TaxID=2834768 RepID=UPI001BD15D7E|nr:helix-turn-helix domain-containing protein [Pseudochrobactrum algeriensis]
MRAWKLCGALMALLSVFFQVSLHDLRSPQRGNCHIARIRQFGMYIAHTMFGLSMSEVAYAFCRERTTVKHACHLIEDMRENEKFDRSVSSFEYLIRALYPCGSVGE